MKNSIFVGRDEQINQLDKLFAEVKKGMGKVVMISGEAGSGKSTLIRQFLLQTETDTNTNSAIVECADKEGLNSYAPFKELLISLNANAVEGSKKSDSMQKLKGFITDAGTQWIATIPVIGSFVAAGISTLQAYKNHYKSDKDTNKAQSEADVHRIFEQELRRLAQKNALIVVLDDLQWADTSSLNLLFMLSKTIRQNPFPIMLIGTYRPNDVNAGRNKILETGENVSMRHPLSDKINELRNYTKNEAHISRTDKWLNEILVPPLTLHDISGLLNRMFPNNQFPKDFHQKLYEISNGHALFANEIINSLLQKNAIVKNDNNVFVLKDANVDELPTSITGVIGERIQRLDKQLKKVLDYASVNGEDFSVQIIEKILKIDELDLLDYIEDLCKKHGLLISAETQQIQDTLFDLYHFTNKLVHKYVYENLEGARRRALHRRVAETIKSIFGDELDKNPELKDKYQKHLQIGKGLIDGVTLQLSQAAQIAESDVSEILDAARAEVQSANETFEQYAMTECVAKADKAMAFITNSGSKNEQAQQIRFDALHIKNKAQNWLGYYKDAYNTALKMLNIAEELNQKINIAETYNQLGINSYKLGNYDNAIEFHQKSLDIALALNNQPLVAENEDNIGEIYDYKGMYDTAIEHYNNAIEINKRLDKKDSLTENYKNTGTALRKKGEFDNAFNYYDKALQLAEKYADKRTIATLINNKGLCINAKGEYEKSIGFFEKALEIDININDRVNMANHYNNIGLANENQGKYDKAIEYYKKTLAIDESLDDRVKMATSYNNIGSIYRAKADFDKAFEYFEKALDINRTLEDKMGMSFTYSNMGNASFLQEDYDRAMRYFEAGLQFDKEAGDKINIATAYINMGNALYSTGKYTEAEIKFNEALQAFSAIDDKLSIAACYNNLGNLNYMLDEYDKAMNYYKKAIDINSAINDIIALAQNYNNIANIYDKKGDIDQAVHYYKRAIETDLLVGDNVQLTMHCKNLAITYKKHAKYKEAIENYKIALQQYLKQQNHAQAADTYEDIAICYRSLQFEDNSTPDNALEYFSKAKNLFITLGDDDAFRRCATSMSEIYEDKSEYRKAAKIYDELIEDALDNNDYTEAANHSNSKGICYMAMSDERRARKAYMQAIEWIDELHFNNAYFYGNIALLDANENNYKKAVANNMVALKYYKKDGNNLQIAEFNKRIARNYIMLNDIKTAFKYYDNALEIYTEENDSVNIAEIYGEVADLFAGNELYDEAINYLNSAALLNEELKNYDALIDNYNSLAEIYFKKSEWNEALRFFNIIHEKAKLEDDVYMEAPAQYNCGLCYQQLNEYQTSIPYFERALKLYRQIESLNDISNSMVKLAFAYYNTGEKEKAIEKLNEVKMFDLKRGKDVSNITENIDKIKNDL